MTKSMNLGPYELRGELGRGAMAKVWRAWDPKLEREVAIKEPLFDEKLSEDILTEMGARFVKEGKAAARLNHPGIVTIYAADVYDSRPVIVMELIEGITLGEMLEAGALAPQVALDALGQLLDAVGYAHSQGVVHRDIKPDNIFITKDGRVKLSDFGIARIEDGNQTKATQIGTVLGTPGYMAPEQATGSAVDNRTDLFAIGTIAYEMLTGQNPFGAGEGTDATTLMYRIVHEPAPSLPETSSAGLPADIRPAVLASLNKSPEQRPQDAASFKAMLNGAPAPPPGSMPAPSRSLSHAAAPASKKKWLPYGIVGGLGALALVLVLVFALSSGGGGVAGGGAPAGANTGSTTNDSSELEDLAEKEESDGLALTAGERVRLGEVTFTNYQNEQFSEDILWRVLAVEEEHALVVTDEIIDVRPYNYSYNHTSWEHSDLRRWLNNDFYSGLPEDIRLLVKEVANQNPDHGQATNSASTQDKVFLLSANEAQRYFTSDRDRQANINLTDKTVRFWSQKYEVDLDELVRLDGGFWWWLRSPGVGADGASRVRYDGSIFDYGIIDGLDNGVRPAMWLKVSPAEMDEGLNERLSEPQGSSGNNTLAGVSPVQRVYVGDAEGEVLRIRELWTADRQAIEAGAYEARSPVAGVAAYSSGGVLRMIEVQAGANGGGPSRIYQYENGQLIFAFFEDVTQERLYFKEGWLFRWRHTDVAGTAVNYDNDPGVHGYLEWEQRAQSEADALKVL